jgi:DNA-binding response OmpR family regulator
LAARIRAVARRLKAPLRESALAEIVLGPLRIDSTGRQARVGDAALQLTPSEFSLLETLASHAGRILSRMALLETVFDSTHEGYARNVDCHVARLRRKLEAAGLRTQIETVYGTGYRLIPPGE